MCMFSPAACVPEVTATVVFTDEGAILVDALPFPPENPPHSGFHCSAWMKVAYVMNTHSHANHVYGTYLFPEAVVVTRVNYGD